MLKLVRTFTLSFLLLSSPGLVQDLALADEACDKLSEKLIVKLKPAERRVIELANDLSFFEGRDNVASAGRMISHWDEGLQSEIYRTISPPLRDGSIPLVDPRVDEALVLLHGSGTKKASGKNFKDMMTAIAQSGSAAISIDMPFHGKNPGQINQEDLDWFMKWFDDFVIKIQKERAVLNPEKPLRLTFGGHSYGPFIAQEYVARFHPHLSQGSGLLLISPSSSLNPALKYTYDNITTPGWKFMEGPPVEPNDAGGKWADIVEKQATWHERPLPKSIPVKIIIGKQDEWWPGNERLPKLLGKPQPHSFEEPLNWYKSIYPQADIEVVDGVGHMIFTKTTADGKNLITERALDALHVPTEDRYTKRRDLTPREEIVLQREVNPAFARWMGNRFRHALRDDFRAKEYLDGWRDAQVQAWKRFLTELPDRHPEFFKVRRGTWARAMAELNRAEKEGKEPYGIMAQALRNDFQSFRKNQNPLALDFDRNGWTISPEFLQSKPQVEKKDGRYVGPPILSSFERALAAADGEIVTNNRVRDGLNEITYRVPGVNAPQKVVLVSNKRDLSELVEQAFTDYLKGNNFSFSTAPRWQGQAYGVKVTGNYTAGSFKQVRFELP